MKNLSNFIQVFIIESQMMHSIIFEIAIEQGLLDLRSCSSSHCYM